MLNSGRSGYGPSPQPPPPLQPVYRRHGVPMYPGNRTGGGGAARVLDTNTNSNGYLGPPSASPVPTYGGLNYRRIDIGALGWGCHGSGASSAPPQPSRQMMMRPAPPPQPPLAAAATASGAQRSVRERGGAAAEPCSDGAEDWGDLQEMAAVRAQDGAGEDEALFDAVSDSPDHGDGSYGTGSGYSASSPNSSSSDSSDSSSSSSDDDSASFDDGHRRRYSPQPLSFTSSWSDQFGATIARDMLERRREWCGLLAEIVVPLVCVAVAVVLWAAFGVTNSKTYSNLGNLRSTGYDFTSGKYNQTMCYNDTWNGQPNYVRGLKACSVLNAERASSSGSKKPAVCSTQDEEGLPVQGLCLYDNGWGLTAFVGGMRNGLAMIMPLDDIIAHQWMAKKLSWGQSATSNLLISAGLATNTRYTAIQSSGKLFFAPTSNVPADMLAFFRNGSTLFDYVYNGTFDSVAEAHQVVKSGERGATWALIHVRQLNAQGLDVTIEMTSTALPPFSSMMDRAYMGGPSYDRADVYYTSGYPSLLHIIVQYYLQSVYAAGATDAEVDAALRTVALARAQREVEDAQRQRNRTASPSAFVPVNVQLTTRDLFEALRSVADGEAERAHLASPNTADPAAATMAAAAQQAGNGDGALSPAHLAAVLTASEVLVSKANATLYMGSMPYVPYQDTKVLSLASIVINLVIVLSFLYPVSQSTRRLVLEKERRVREAMKIMGLRSIHLWCSWFLHSLALNFTISFLMSVLMCTTFMTRSDPFCVFLVIFLFSLTCIPLSGLLATFYDTSRMAALMTPLIYFAMCVPTFAMPSASPATYLGLSIFSPTAFAVVLQSAFAWESGDGFSARTFRDPSNAPSTAILLGFFGIDFTVYLLLMFYLDEVLPKAVGVAKHPLFFILDPIRWCRRKQRAKVLQRETEEGRSGYYSAAQWQGDEDNDACCGCCGEAHLDDEDGLRRGQDGRDPAGVYEEEQIAPHQQAVRIEGLRKDFKRSGRRFVAVRNLYWTLPYAGISVLLGHNGAGKTTVMNMVTGMLDPDDGDCYICGYSVRHELAHARHEIGYCPQHNILWPDLTCREHLEFFGRIKGLRGAALEDAVFDTMREVDLLDKEHDRSRSLSGGMKRKLSVAIAFVGGCRLVFLDEPTAGMDAAARRHTWELLLRMSRTRSVLLTTHFMDEADLLGDRVAIMSRGQLKCSGSSLFLKSRLGVGYNISISVDPTVLKVRQLDAFLHQHVPLAERLTGSGGEVDYRLPSKQVSRFPGLLKALDTVGPILGVRGYAVSPTTLEEVFLKIARDASEVDKQRAKAREEARRARAVARQQQQSGSGGCMAAFANWLCCRPASAPRRRWYNADDEDDASDTASSAYYDDDAYYGDSGSDSSSYGDAYGSATSGYGDGYESSAGSAYPSSSSSSSSDSPSPSRERTEVGALMTDRLHSANEGNDGAARVEMNDGALLHLCDAAGDSSDTVVTVPAKKHEDAVSGGLRVGAASSVAAAAATAAAHQRASTDIIWTCETVTSTTHLTLLQAEAMMRKRLYYLQRDSKMLCFQIICPVVCVLIAMLLNLARSYTVRELAMRSSSYPYEVQWELSGCADAFIGGTAETTAQALAPNLHIHDVNAKSMADYTYSLQDDWYVHGNVKKYGGLVCGAPALATTPTLAANPVVVFTNYSAYHELPIGMTNWYNMLLQSVRGTATSVKAQAALLPSRSGAVSQSSIRLLLMGILIMIPFTFLPANCVAWVVKERECRSRHLQEVCGLRYLIYWLCNFVFDYAAYVVTMLLVITIFAIFDRQEYISKDTVGATFTLFAVFGFCSTATAYLVQFCFNTHSSAQSTVMAVGFVSGFLLVIIVFVLNLLDSAKSASETMRKVFRVFPTYAVGEGIINLSMLEQAKLAHPQLTPFSMEVIGWPCVYMAIEGPVFLLFALLLDHPYWRLRWQLRHYNPNGADAELSRERRRAAWGAAAAAASSASGDEDSDVEAERVEVRERMDRYHAEKDHLNRSRSFAGDAVDDYEPPVDAIAVVDLHKRYGNGKVAVQDLTFGVVPGEVFGFLGTNGAGKTTTMSILCQEFYPTSGHVYVCGYDIVEESREALQCVGYCPQFDATLDLLTVKEHLQVFAGIRGIRRCDQAAVVRALIQLMGLREYRHTTAASLSGGNRRKLSMALALIGGPQVVILDEPSAGMDPVARREMWTSIQAFKDHCSVVLCTHHLEEVEALADCVAIMVDGQLRCIGNKVHLKQKFGSGLEMTVRVQPPSSARPATDAESSDTASYGSVGTLPSRGQSPSQDAAELEAAQNRVVDFVTETFPSSQLNEVRGQRIVFTLPKDTNLSDVFQRVQEQRAELHISDYTVAQTSIEQVFLRINEEAEAAAQFQHSLTEQRRDVEEAILSKRAAQRMRRREKRKRRKRHAAKQ